MNSILAPKTSRSVHTQLAIVAKPALPQGQMAYRSEPNVFTGYIVHVLGGGGGGGRGFHVQVSTSRSVGQIGHRIKSYYFLKFKTYYRTVDFRGQKHTQKQMHLVMF